MTEEITEVKPDFLAQVKAEREALEKVRDENTKLLEEFKKLKAEDILSGKAPQPRQEPAVEESPQDYLKRILQNK